MAGFIRQHRTSDPLITTKVQAIITFYAGDPSFAYEQLDERETLEAEQDLQFQYYMQLSALNFHHTKERMHITEGGASIARELLNANTQPSSDEHVRQWYYAGRFLWHHQAYQEAIQCWEKVSHFPPALYMLMYGYHQQQMMPERNDVVSRIIAMEQQGVGLVSHVKPVLLGLESSVSTTQDTIFRYVYAREIAETLDVLAECVTQQHSFVADFRSALASSVTDIWTIPPTTLEKIDHYETEALNHAIQHLADTIKRHSDLVAEWLKEGLPQKIVPKVGALITDSYNENLIHQELNSDLLTYLFLSKQINYYDRLFLEVWNRVVELKKRRFHPLTEETVKAAVAIAMTLATPKVLAGIEDDAVTLPINNFLIQLSPIFALVVINYINHRISVGKVSDIEDNYSEFRNQFAIYIENTKEELGEEKFYERYPLAGFDEWVKQS